MVVRLETPLSSCICSDKTVVLPFCRANLLALIELLLPLVGFGATFLCGRWY